MISISGRPRREWDATLAEVGGALVLRIEDRADREFWLEVSICRDSLYPAALATLRTSLMVMHKVEADGAEIAPSVARMMLQQLGGTPPPEMGGGYEIVQPAQS